MIRSLGVVLSVVALACQAEPVGQRLTSARAADGSYISWQEHLIDDASTAGFALSGSDGLVMADIDGDGHEDIVSVHESDDEYDSAVADDGYIPDSGGHVRIAFGSKDPLVWQNITLAEGTDTPAPEDAAIADVNGDGHLDVVVATELAHLIYLQNPGEGVREVPWPRLILPMTRGKGSYIRVFAGDLDGDGLPELSAANKGAQRPSRADFLRSNPASLFIVEGDPLVGENWREQELGRFSVPQNARPVDLDGDGDLDIVVGTRGEQRILWFENLGDLRFAEHAIGIVGAVTGGFNMDFADLNGDGRMDIVAATRRGVAWFEQPEVTSYAWPAHQIGTFRPDSVTGLILVDINGDGHLDLFAGSYSRGERQADSASVDLETPLGRLGWFANPGKDAPEWERHDVSRRVRGMFDKFEARDLDGDGDVDIIGTRGNSAPYDGVFWLEQQRRAEPAQRFVPARRNESAEVALPALK